MAYPLGDWNLGAGASVRRSRAYEPFDVPGESFRYQPGNEVRLRLGIDRPRRGGTRSPSARPTPRSAATTQGGSAYNTGDRVIALGELTGRLGEHDYTVAAYNVFRAPGSTPRAIAPAARTSPTSFSPSASTLSAPSSSRASSCATGCRTCTTLATPPGPRARRAAGSRPSACARGSMQAVRALSGRWLHRPRPPGLHRRRRTPRPGDAHRLPRRAGRARRALSRRSHPERAQRVEGSAPRRSTAGTERGS